VKKIFVSTWFLVVFSFFSFSQEYIYKKYLGQINKDITESFGEIADGYMKVKNLGNGKYYIKAVNGEGHVFVSVELSFAKKSSNYYYYTGTGYVGSESDLEKFECTVETFKLKLSDFAKGAGNDFNFRVEEKENIIRFQLNNDIENATMNLVPIIN
jgi:hypothetical protein